MNNIIISYQCGDNNGVPVDFMTSQDGELYAEEVISSDRLSENGDFLPGEEDASRDRLRAEIIRQATAAGIDPDLLKWN